LVACTTNNEENTTKTFDQHASEKCKHYNVSFCVTKYTRTHIEGTLERFKLTTDELTKRRRKGRMIEFTNHDEIYLKSLTIDQPVNTKIVKFDMSEINLLTSNEENDDNTLAGNQVVKQIDTEVLGNRLSRVLVDQVRINFRPSKRQPVVLTANYAKILTDTGIMRLEGNVRLEATKCKMSSAVAIWSNVYNGLFFSESFQFNNKTFKPPALFQITSTGKCHRVRSVHNVEYVDQLDVVEDKMFELMPESTQLLFGLLGSPTNLTGVAD
jgi:hypothetical protein